MDPLKGLHIEISGHADKISRLFKNPAAIMVTIVVRNTEADEGRGDVLVSDDDSEQAIEAIRRLVKDPAAVAFGKAIH